MASIRFGDIVTGIKGSIGGTTYREYKNTWIAQARSRGGNKTLLRENPKLAQLNTVVQDWSKVNIDDKLGWQGKSQEFWFTDKWGNPVQISGRNFYIKIANGCKNIGNPITRWYDISTIVGLTFLNWAYISIQNGAFAEFYTEDSAGGYATIHAIQIPKGRNYTLMRQGPILWGGLTSPDLTIDFTTAFFNRYPYAQPGDEFNIGATYYSYHGFKGFSDQINITITI